MMAVEAIRECLRLAAASRVCFDFLTFASWRTSRLGQILPFLFLLLCFLPLPPRFRSPPSLMEGGILSRLDSLLDSARDLPQILDVNALRAQARELIG